MKRILNVFILLISLVLLLSTSTKHTYAQAGCCSTVDDCTPRTGYTVECVPTSECFPGNGCVYTSTSCWCPHACLPGVGGCNTTGGVYSCRMECCDPGPCPTLPPDPSDGLVNFSDLIRTTAPNFVSSTPSYIITILLPYIYGAAGLAMLLFLVLGAYQIMISSGDPKQMAAGRDKITYAIVGFVIMFAAYWITRIAGDILDIQQIKSLFGEVSY